MERGRGERPPFAGPEKRAAQPPTRTHGWDGDIKRTTEEV